jgi:hypothetical protein
MRRIVQATLVAILLTATTALATGPGGVRSIVIQILDGLGITVAGVYTAPTLQNVTTSGASTTVQSTFSSGIVTGAAGVEVGNATDTTLTRASAGDVQVEGNRIFRVGGTDVPISDGGTGQSTATAGFDALAPTTTRGDLITRGASSNGRLATGASGTVLVGGTDPSWSATPSVTTLTSTQATGTAPFTVASTTKVTNLNADTLDGLDSTALQPIDSDLTTIAGLTATTGNTLQAVGSAWASVTPSAARQGLAVDNVYQVFLPSVGAVAPASNPATFNVRNNHSLLEFDTTTAESITYESVMPAAYDSTRNLSVTVWVTSTATTNSFVMSAAFERIGTTQDIDSDSFQTAVNSASTAISGTSGVPVSVTIAVSNGNADSVAAGEPYRLTIARVPGDAG